MKSVKVFPGSFIQRKLNGKSITNASTFFHKGFKFSVSYDGGEWILNRVNEIGIVEKFAVIDITK